MKFIKRHPRVTLSIIGVLLICYWFCLPNPLFTDPTCMILEDRKGDLLGARIAADGQWRFPHQEEVPEKFVQAITEFEDRRFFYHPGIDPIGLMRAMKQNIANGSIVSGASTLTMQVMRMARKPDSRSVFQKVIEIILATRLELKYSKKEILAFYASNAPFGGNVVGLDAASWRYFAKSPKLLSWSEAATLAVLPNSPALIHPGRNRQSLLEKRNRLLERLLKKEAMDSISYQLALEEPLPEKPHRLPRLAPHLLDRAFVTHFRGKKNQRTRLRTTLDQALQGKVTALLKRHNNLLKNNQIHNLAALVIEVESGDLLAYVGNVLGAGKTHSEEVDVIRAPRSTGSILKPLLYALMLQEGSILPNSLVSDIPTHLTGYRPENFYENYDGVVSARRAIIRSLNIPLVRMLQNYGLEKFHFELQDLGFYSINRSPDYYGLPLIVGGAEASLWEIANTYTRMARTLNHFYQYDGLYDPQDVHPPNYIFDQKRPSTPRDQLLENPPNISAAATWLTFDAMQDVERPNSEGEWQRFESSHRIAWKTGTSFGFRDAWSVGITPRYVVGVWAGNADGEGRPGLVGVRAAAPVLFDIFDLLPVGEWFDQPFDEMRAIEICRQSGYRALEICEKDTIWSTISGSEAQACPYHKRIHLDASGTQRVHSECEDPSKMQHQSWFVLPPIEEFYFKTKNPSYRPLPAFRADCRQTGVAIHQPMQLIYPKHRTKIYVPFDLNGELSRTVFKVAHRSAEMTIHWHLDNQYVGSTTAFHHLELAPTAGEHSITLVDEEGYRLTQDFEVIGK